MTASTRLFALLSLALFPVACTDAGSEPTGDPGGSSGAEADESTGGTDGGPAGDASGDGSSSSAAELEDDSGGSSGGEAAPRAVEPGDLVITEIDLADGTAGQQWLELQNMSTEDISLEGVVLRNADGVTSAPFPDSLVLGPLEHLVLAQSSAAISDARPTTTVFYGASPALDTDVDTLTLEREDDRLERVAWDRGAGWPLTRGETLSLAPEQLSAADNDLPGSWCSQPTPTPGSANAPCTDLSATEPGAGNLVLTEVMARPLDGSDWVEIYNPGRHPIRLHGVRIETDDASVEIADGGLELSPGARLVLSEDVDGFPPEVPTFELDALSLGRTETIVLRHARTVIDQLSYDRSWVNDTGHTLELDPSRTTAAGNDSALNWCASTQLYGSPGRTNETCAYTDEVPYPAPSDLQITELMVNPPASDEGHEWFEVFNAGATPLRLDHLVLTDSHQDEANLGFVGQALAPGAYAVLAQDADLRNSLPAGTLVVEYGPQLRLQNNRDTLSIERAGERIAQVDYDDHDDWPLDAGASMTLSSSEVGGANDALATSWCSSSTPVVLFGDAVLATPGGPGELCPLDLAPPPSAGDLVITEFMAKVEGEDDGAEWIELHNRSDGPRRLNGLELRVGGTTHELEAPGLSIPAGAYAVLAQSTDFDTSHPDITPTYYYGTELRLGNEADSIRLRYDGEELDEVSYDEDDPLWLVTAGYSTSLHPSATTAELNDDALQWCLGWASNPDATRRGTPGTANEPCPLRAGEPWPFVEDDDAYAQDAWAPIVLEVEVDPVAFAELRSINTIEERDAATPADIVFSADDYPHAADGDALAHTGRNGTITVRGASSIGAPQNSWKIRLDGDAYRGQTTLHLSKHTFDITRIRNALGARMLRDVPFVPSFRTQFVHLYVNGEDMGLFTQNEQLDERYLRRRHFDERGGLFKAQGFHFGVPSAEERAAGEIEGLESKALDDQAGVFAMLDGLHDTSLSFEEVVARHFDRRNLIDFISAYYLIKNVDSVEQNYYIYAPINDPERFYLLPWDLDGGWDFYGQDPQPIPSWRDGLANWWGNELFRRMLQDQVFVDEVVARIHELAPAVFAPADVDAIADQLELHAGPFQSISPDGDPGMQPRAWEWRDEEVARLSGIPAARDAELDAAVQRPMPFYQAVYNLGAGEVLVRFVGAYDVQGDALTTTIAFAPAGCAGRDYECFENSIELELEGFEGEEVRLDRATDLASLAAGTYDVLTYAVDEHGHTQASYSEGYPWQVQLE